MPTIAANGINLYYEQHGEGPSLICIMGITARGSVWEAHLTEWQKHFRCVAVDNRGVGRSDMPPGPYTSELMADDYAGLMETLGIERSHFIGCSMGSTIVQQLALRHPQKVRSAVLMCPWARCDRYTTGVFEHLVHIKARLTPAELAHYIQLLIFAKGHWDNDQRFEEMIEGRRLVSIDPSPQPLFALEAQAAACKGHDVLHELSKITCPALVIGGRQDIFTPRWMAEEIAESIPNCDLHLYEGAGHAFHWEWIEDFNPRIVRWLLAH